MNFPKLLPFPFLIILLGACTDDSTDDIVPLVEMGAFTQITDLEGNSYEVGFDQVSSQNQDSYVIKRNSDGSESWRIVHGASPVDERAVLVNLDTDGKPWVVFTVDGGSNSSDYINQREIEPGAFDGVFLNSYGRASGTAKVTILARLDPITGKIEKGTFLMSRTNEGDVNAVEKTNSFEVTRLGFEPDGVILEANSWFLPPAVNATQSNFTHHPDATEENKQGDNWVVQLKLPFDLSRLIRSEIIK